MSLADSRPPLHGVRVLDFSHYVSAATCGLVLAELGADVVKVERNGGDDLRRLGPSLGGAAASFQWANRNKQGLVLDLKSSAGRAVAADLAREADVLIENFSTGVMDRFGLGAETLLALNPRLVYCSIPAYARTGPRAGRAGFDPIVQAESGLMAITGPEGSMGSRVGAPVADVGTGLLAAIAVLGALAARARTGLGQRVEVALFDSAVTLAAIPIMNYLANGISPKPAGSASREAAPTDFFAAADGPIYIACTSDSLFQRLAGQVLARPELATDPRFCSNALRFENREALRADIEAVLRTRGRREWLPLLHAAQVPAGLLNDIPGLLASEEFTGRGMLAGADSDQPALALPFRFDATPSVSPGRAPARGEHTAQVLGEWLGRDAGQVHSLALAGAFGAVESAT